MDKYISDLTDQGSDFLQIHQMFASRVLSLRPGQKAIVTNGAVSNSSVKFISGPFYISYC